MSLRLDVVSIGALDRNLLWQEAEPVRTAHATCTLIRAGKRNILVDPGLPPVAMVARLAERTGLKPEQIDTVFLTSFRPAHRAGLAAFGDARIYLHEREVEGVRPRLQRFVDELEPGDDEAKHVRHELALLDRCQSPDDRLAPQVDLFPLPGSTPGNCGLLVSAATMTYLVTGLAVGTQDHFLAGQLLPEPSDLAAAKESLQEAYEIADVIVPAYDNLFLNPRAAGM